MENVILVAAQLEGVGGGRGGPLVGTEPVTESPPTLVAIRLWRGGPSRWHGGFMAAISRSWVNRPSLAGRFKSTWRLARWPLFGLLVAAALVLGFVGFDRYFVEQDDPRGMTDLVYLTLQLFVLESGSVPQSAAPWQLEVSRLLAPATTGLAIAVALAAVFREELSELRLRFQKGHVVVCGLGDMGARLAGALLEAGHRVVGVERDPSNPAIARLRRQGALVLEGDARDTEVLRRARIDRAGYVVALTGADDANAELAIRAGELAPRQGRALTCLAHVRDPGLCALLRSEELAAAHTASYRLDFFNVFEQAARALLSDYPPAGSFTQEHALAIIGATPVGQAIVVEAVRRWRVQPAARERRIVMAVIDPEAKRVVDALKDRYPQLEHTAELRPIGEPFEHVDRAFLRATSWDAVFVCVDDDSGALDIGLQVRRLLGDDATPVVIELTRSSGLAELLRRPDVYDGLSAFDLFELTLQPELLLGGTYEVLARAIHSEYAAEQRRQGATAASNPSLVPWEELPESLRESNRDQAAHIGAKLAAIGCAIAPLTDWDADRQTFDEADVERLAELEHERWVDQRVRDGWTAGPKDVEKKVSPYLIPWAQLSDDVKEWDRRAVRGIPGFLARAGYQVVGSGIT